MTEHTELDSFVRAFREAAPYIHYLRDKTIVLAISSHVIAAEQFNTLAQDISLLGSLGIKVVVVHGVRKYINDLMQASNASLPSYQGRRITNEKTLVKVKQACGEVRFDLEAALSVGLINSPQNGTRNRLVSGNFISAKPLGVIDGVDMGYTGTIRRIDFTLIKQLLQQNCMVLVSPIGHSLSGKTFSLSMDEVAAEVAIGLRAEKLVFINEEAGIINAQGQLVRNLSANEAAAFFENVPQQKAIKRLLPSTLHALQQGVKRVQFIGAHTEGSLFSELFTKNGSGTSFAQHAFVHIRQAVSDDIPDIMRMIRPLEDQGVLVHRSHDYLENHIDEFSILEHDEQVYGCVALKRFSGSDMGELACLVVSPDAQEGGYGELLLEHVQKQARAFKLKTLFCLSTHTGEWFSERGFQDTTLAHIPLERQRQYHQDGRGSHVYLLPL